MSMRNPRWHKGKMPFKEEEQREAYRPDTAQCSADLLTTMPVHFAASKLPLCGCLKIHRPFLKWAGAYAMSEGQISISWTGEQPILKQYREESFILPKKNVLWGWSNKSFPPAETIYSLRIPACSKSSLWPILLLAITCMTFQPRLIYFCVVIFSNADWIKH